MASKNLCGKWFRFNFGKQPTFFIKLAKELEANKNASNLEFYLKLKEVENRVSKGLDKDEAIAQVFSFDVAEEVKKLKK